VNGRSRTISPKGSVFLLDPTSRIKIVVPSNDLLAGPKYTISLTKFIAEPKKFNVESSQRVIRLVGNVSNADDLKNAQSTSGKAVFAGYASDKLEDTSSVLNQFPQMMGSVDAKSASDNLTVPVPESKDCLIQYTRSEGKQGVIEILTGWVDEAVEWIENHILADLVNLFKKAVKTLVKFAVKIVGKAVSFIFHIAGKVLGFAVSTAEKLLSG
jgi:hypothetical protein